jgi:hypothetical protein
VYEQKTPEGFNYTFTEEVTDTTEFTGASEYTDWKARYHVHCYTVEWTFDPHYLSVTDSSTVIFDEGTKWVEKATLNVFMDVTVCTRDGESAWWTTSYHYIFPGVPYWPLETGKVIRKVVI